MEWAVVRGTLRVSQKEDTKFMAVTLSNLNEEFKNLSLVHSAVNL